MSKLKSKDHKVIIVAVLLSVIINFSLNKFVARPSDSSESVSDKEIATYIENNAGFIIEAVNNHYKNEMANQKKGRGELLKKKQKEVYENSDDPIIGNTNGSIAVVEFFDYNCGYCKKTLPTILRVAKDFPDARIILKELPILGHSSELKAKMSLAANFLNSANYEQAHQKIMMLGRVGSLEAIADSLVVLGYDKAELIKEANSTRVEAAIDNNKKLARTLSIGGTPAFIVKDEFVDGAASYDQIKAIINGK